MSISKIASRAVAVANIFAAVLATKTLVDRRSQDRSQFPSREGNNPKRPLASQHVPRLAKSSTFASKPASIELAGEERIEADKYFVETDGKLVFTGNVLGPMVADVRPKMVEEVIAQTAHLSPDAQLRRLLPLVEILVKDERIGELGRLSFDCFEVIALRVQAWSHVDQAKGIEVLTSICHHQGDKWDQSCSRLLEQIKQWRNPELQGPALAHVARAIAVRGRRIEEKQWAGQYAAMFEMARDWTPKEQAPVMESLGLMLHTAFGIGRKVLVPNDDSQPDKSVFPSKTGPQQKYEHDWVPLFKSRQDRDQVWKKEVPLALLFDKHHRLAEHVRDWAPEFKLPVVAALEDARGLLPDLTASVVESSIAVVALATKPWTSLLTPDPGRYPLGRSIALVRALHSQHIWRQAKDFSPAVNALEPVAEERIGADK